MANVSFIVGTGRCGTTLLAKMLNSHSEICVPHELQILFETSNNGARLFEIFKEGRNVGYRASDFVKLIESRCPHKFHEYYDYRSFFERQHYPIMSLPELVNGLYGDIAVSRNKTIFMEQTPWYGQGIVILNDMFPDAKYIHIIRDGRDVAISFARTPWWHNDIGQNLERWCAEINQIINSAHQILRPNQFFQLRYEDVVEQPETIIRQICDFLGVVFEVTMLDPATFIDYGLYSRSKTESITSTALNEWSSNKKTPTFKGSLYAWKSYRDFDFSKIPENIRECLLSLGYET